MGYTSEQRQEIVEHYKAGESMHQIAKSTNLCRRHITKYIDKLIAAGELPPRQKHVSTGRPHGKISDKQMAFMLQMLSDIKAGLSIEELCVKYKMSRSGVQYYKKKMRDELGWDLTSVKRSKKYSLTQKEQIKKQQMIPLKVNDEPIKCTQSVARTCIYGERWGCSDNGLCRFILCEGHSRGCSPKKCVYYQKVTKENKRRLSIL